MRRKLKVIVIFTIAISTLAIGKIPVLAAEQPSTATVGLAPGQLTLDYVPDIDFGTNHPIDPAGISIDATIDDNHCVQVSDYEGDHDGWKLTVKQAATFKSNAVPADELQGTQITFTTDAINYDTNLGGSPTAPATFIVEPTNQEVDVLQDLSGASGGKYTLPFKAINLKIPTTSAVYAGNYSTTLTWILTDVASE